MPFLIVEWILNLIASSVAHFRLLVSIWCSIIALEYLYRLQYLENKILVNWEIFNYWQAFSNILFFACHHLEDSDVDTDRQLIATLISPCIC